MYCNPGIKMEQPPLNCGIKVEQALDLNISSGIKMEQALDLNISSGLKMDQAMDLNISSDKVRSLCLAVELCVVCGDRASGNHNFAIIVLCTVVLIITLYGQEGQ